MPELIAKTALGGPVPLLLAATELAEAPILPMTSVAPYPGREEQVNAALKPLGVAFPVPNSQSAKGDVRLIWTGRDQAFLIGAPAPEGLAEHAALTDQADGWARLTLTGPQAEAALARLVPIDLRANSFPIGSTTRAPLGHMSMILSRISENGFEIMIFRSTARTAWHEIGDALEHLHARASAL
ncbi:MAG: sarcosine oxidase subunit gamma [Rhodobacteraceae bacterium PARR1]|nr:MAG: sarcosine oxidase subunit gamma [Rhodobacteraceae bacterium PARR1]